MRTAYIVVVLAASARAFFAPAAGALMARRSPAAASSSARQRWPALQAAVPPSTGAVSKNGLDIRAMVALPTLTATQFVTIAGLFRLIDTYAPAALLSSRAATPAVWSAFLFLAVKSRVFSLLDNSRPQREGEAAAKAERRRPTWTPPPLAFPIIWSTIGLLRASSATVVWRATGRKLCSWPLLALVAHLCIGDSWNHITNVREELGFSAASVFTVLASVFYATDSFYAVSPLAGKLLAPSCVWLTVATALVFNIWLINKRSDGTLQRPYPTKIAE